MDEIYTGKRVYLKRLKEYNIDERYVSWFENKELLKYYSGSKRKYTRDYLIEDLIIGEQTGSHFIYGIFLKTSDLLIGNVKVGPIIQPHNITDLSLIIGDQDYHGKGMAIEAFKLGNHVTFVVHGIRKISSGMYADNKSSYYSLCKADWVIEGRRKGHYLVDGIPMDQVLVSSFNPHFFSINEIKNEFSNNKFEE